MDVEKVPLLSPGSQELEQVDDNSSGLDDSQFPRNQLVFTLEYILRSTKGVGLRSELLLAFLLSESENPRDIGCIVMGTFDPEMDADWVHANTDGTVYDVDGLLQMLGRLECSPAEIGPRAFCDFLVDVNGNFYKAELVIHVELCSKEMTVDVWVNPRCNFSTLLGNFSHVEFSAEQRSMVPLNLGGRITPGLRIYSMQETLVIPEGRGPHGVIPRVGDAWPGPSSRVCAFVHCSRAESKVIGSGFFFLSNGVMWVLTALHVFRDSTHVRIPESPLMALPRVIVCDEILDVSAFVLENPPHHVHGWKPEEVMEDHLIEAGTPLALMGHGSGDSLTTSIFDGWSGYIVEGLLRHTIPSRQGDSGAPVLALINAQWWIVAIHLDGPPRFQGRSSYWYRHGRMMSRVLPLIQGLGN